jgi:hypothetical protein
MKLRSDRDAPKYTNARTDSDEDNRAILLNDKELPMWRKPNTAKADPSRAKPRKDTELPKQA